MATLREYFNSDPKAITIHSTWSYDDGSHVVAKVVLNFEANARYWYIFIPSCDDPVVMVRSVLKTPQFERCKLKIDGDGVDFFAAGMLGVDEGASSSTLIFTRRVFIYVDMKLSEEMIQQMIALGTSHGYITAIRDTNHAEGRSELEKPIVFISHDSRDKDSLVRGLAEEMIKCMCPTWYDEFSLKVGDSLRTSIERGLKEARKCVVVLSPNFFNNHGWTKAEFDSIFTREIIEERNLILPVWHKVSVRDVFNYSPRLADKVGLNSDMGIELLAKKLSAAAKDLR